MKNLYKRPLASLIGIVALVAVISLGLAGHPTDDGGGGTGIAGE